MSSLRSLSCETISHLNVGFTMQGMDWIRCWLNNHSANKFEWVPVFGESVSWIRILLCNILGGWFTADFNRLPACVCCDHKGNCALESPPWCHLWIAAMPRRRGRAGSGSLLPLEVPSSLRKAGGRSMLSSKIGSAGKWGEAYSPLACCSWIGCLRGKWTAGWTLGVSPSTARPSGNIGARSSTWKVHPRHKRAKWSNCLKRKELSLLNWNWNCWSDHSKSPHESMLSFRMRQFWACSLSS